MPAGEKACTRFVQRLRLPSSVSMRFVETYTVVCCVLVGQSVDPSARFHMMFIAFEIED
jgi:hypothetical protein